MYSIVILFELNFILKKTKRKYINSIKILKG